MTQLRRVAADSIDVPDFYAAAAAEEVAAWRDQPLFTEEEVLAALAGRDAADVRAHRT